MISSRILTVRSLAKQMGGSKRPMGYYVGTFKPPSMNDMPVPTGSWAIANAQMQSKYNLFLGFAIAFTTTVYAVGKATGKLNFLAGPAYKNLD